MPLTVAAGRWYAPRRIRFGDREDPGTRHPARGGRRWRDGTIDAAGGPHTGLALWHSPGWPGAPGAPADEPAGCSTSVVSEYAGRVWLVALPVWDEAIEVAPLVREYTVGAAADGAYPA